MKITKTCKYCGKEYQVSESQEQRSKFCSDKCFRASRNTRMDYACDYCGKIFKVRKSKIDKVKSGKSKGLYCCSQCAKDAQKPKWKDIVQLFKDKNYELLSTEYINAKTKLRYICNKHTDMGEQSITFSNLSYGFGCKYCGRERQGEKRRCDFEEVKKVFEKHDMELLDQPYINAQTPMAYICKHHREYGIQYMSKSNADRQHCPYCHKYKGESKIADFLIENNIDYILHKTYDDLLGVKNGRLSYEFYWPEFHLLIEFQGEQHEHAIDAFGGEETFKTQQEHDKRKKEYAIKHNIELLEIWYYDISKIEEILTDKLQSCV